MRTDDARNREALDRIAGTEPRLVDIRRAGDVVPGLAEGVLLHAGPPLSGWDQASEVLRASAEGSLVVNGVCESLEAAREHIRAGGMELRSAQDHDVLATYAGVIGSETTVLVVEDARSGHRTFAGINEGRGKALRYGANDERTLRRLRWLESTFADAVAEATRGCGGIDLFAISEQAIRMGDEGHSRQKAASALFANAVCLGLLASGIDRSIAHEAAAFLVSNELFYLSLSMAAAKCAMRAGEGVAGSTIVSSMAFNGMQFGMQVTGNPGRWYVAPAPDIEGQYFEGHSRDDACTVIGDSEIAETMGLGAFAMAGAPALARYIGGTPETAAGLSTQMYEITCAEHPRFRIPAWEFRGTPFGIDVARVVDTGIAPVFSTGIAHRRPGVGQIGAGWGRAPMAPFREALAELG